MTLLHAAWKYLQERQSPKIRFLHIVVLLCVISQIIVSNFMKITHTGDIGGSPIEFYGTWTHILTGLLLLPIALVFTWLLLKEHGIKYFFPYLFGDFEHLRHDIKKLIKFLLPEPEAGGIATIVQGLGVGALFLALLSGLTWFITWKYDIGWSHNIKEVHESLVGLIEAYVIGHGAMGLVHMYFTAKQAK